MSVVIWIISIAVSGTIAYLCSGKIKESVRKCIFVLSLATCIVLVIIPKKFGVEIENFPDFLEVFPTILSLAIAFLAVFLSNDDKKEQATQYKDLIKKLNDIESKLENLENNLPTTQDTSTSEDSFLSRLLHCLCGK